MVEGLNSDRKLSKLITKEDQRRGNKVITFTIYSKFPFLFLFDDEKWKNHLMDSLKEYINSKKIYTVVLKIVNDSAVKTIEKDIAGMDIVKVLWPNLKYERAIRLDIFNKDTKEKLDSMVITIIYKYK